MALELLQYDICSVRYLQNTPAYQNCLRKPFPGFPNPSALLWDFSHIPDSHTIASSSSCDVFCHRDWQHQLSKTPQSPPLSIAWQNHMYSITLLPLFVNRLTKSSRISYVFNKQLLPLSENYQEHFPDHAFNSPWVICILHNFYFNCEYS